jgi:hypothetical protein
MIRVSAPYLINFFQSVEHLSSLPTDATALRQVFLPLFEAQMAIANLYLPESLYRSHLRLSYSTADRLFSAITKLTSQTDMDEEVSAIQISAIKILYEQYKTLVLAELDALDLYLVAPKEPYNIFPLPTHG